MRATLSDVAIGGEVAIKGRVLYLTSDSALLQRQLSGENLTFDPQRSLIDNISTDELTPGGFATTTTRRSPGIVWSVCAVASCRKTRFATEVSKSS